MGRKNGREFSLVIAVIITAILFVYRNIEKVGETEVKLFLPNGQEDVLYVVSDQEQAVTWSVKPEDILVLTENDNGSCTVRAVKDGSATVTAKTLDGTEIAQRRVEVASFIDNNDFIWAVENGIDSEFKPVTVNWKKEKDGMVKLTPENLAVIQDVTSLDISGQDLTELSGVEWFTGLEYLNCGKNK